MSIPLGLPFYVLVSNFSDRKIRLPKYMIIANKAAPPSVIHAIDSTDQKGFPIETPR